MNVDYFRYLALAGNFLNFRLCEIQLGAQCLLGEHGPLMPPPHMLHRHYLNVVESLILRKSISGVTHFLFSLFESAQNLSWSNLSSSTIYKPRPQITCDL